MNWMSASELSSVFVVQVAFDDDEWIKSVRGSCEWTSEPLIEAFGCQSFRRPRNCSTENIQVRLRSTTLHVLAIGVTHPLNGNSMWSGDIGSLDVNSAILRKRVVPPSYHFPTSPRHPISILAVLLHMCPFVAIGVCQSLLLRATFQDFT